MESKAQEVMGLISAEDLDLTEYSDALVYRINERITVLSKEEIRIRFIGGIRGLSALEELADSCEGVAFAMHPTSMEELLAVADAGMLMPPKSTWFEPKLRSGLFIHRF